jgi:hypothetical protein
MLPWPHDLSDPEFLNVLDDHNGQTFASGKTAGVELAMHFIDSQMRCLRACKIPVRVDLMAAFTRFANRRPRA